MTGSIGSSVVWHVIRRLVVLGLAIGLVVAAALSAMPAHAQEAKTLHWGFPEGQLLRAQNSPDVYVLEGRYKRLITSLQVFEDYGYRWEDVETLSPDELMVIPRSNDVRAGPVYRDPDGIVWIVYEGARRRVIGDDTYGALFLRPSDAQPIGAAELAAIPEGWPVGNPIRRWLLPVVLLPLLGGVLLWLWDTGRRSRHTHAWSLLALILTISVVLKVYYVLLFPWVPDGWDGLAYHTAGRALVEEGLLTRHGHVIRMTASAYSFLLAAVYAVAGIHPLVVKVVQVVPAVGIAAFVMLITRRLFGPRAARLAGAVAVLSPVWLYSAELIAYELWLALGTVVTVWCLVNYAHASHHQSRLLWLNGAGAVLGFSLFMQLKMALLLVLASGYIWYVEQHRRSGTTLSRLRFAAGMLQVFAVLWFLALLPTALYGVRNLRVWGEFVPTTVSSGVVLWTGNNPTATGAMNTYPQTEEFWQLLHYYRAQGIVATSETRAYTQVALRYMAENPSSTLRLTLRKLHRLWGAVEPDVMGEHVNRRMVAFLGGWLDEEALRSVSGLLHMGSLFTLTAGAFAVCWPVGIAQGQSSSGIVRAGRWLVLLTIVLFWLSHAPFLGEARYRIPIVPLVHVLQGVGLVLLRDLLPWPGSTRRTTREAHSR